MSDEIDLAQREIDWAQQMTVRAVMMQSHHLAPLGYCHHCEETLPIAGQLFCDTDCARDFERVSWAQRMANK
jgi:hypothetical protein